MGGGQSVPKYHKPPASYLGEYKEDKYYVTNPWEEKPIVYAKEGPASQKAVTIMQLFDEVCATNPNGVMYCQEKKDKDGKMVWDKITKKRLRETVMRTSRAFIKLGLKDWESVCIMGFNAPEWVYSYLASIYAGGLACGIYTTNNSGQCEFIVNNAKARIAVIENQKLLKKFLPIRDKCPTLQYIVLYNDKVPDGCNEDGKAKVITFEDLLKEGDDEKLDEEITKRCSERKAGQCASLIYTSGTTGKPKGVMMSHDNLTYNATALISTFPDIDWKAEHRIISYLPMSHVAAQFLDIICVLKVTHGLDGKGNGNCSAWFARPDALKGTLKNTLNDAKPTIFMGVPRVWEKLEDAVKAVGKKSGAMTQTIGGWAKSIGLQKTKNFKVGGSHSYPAGFTLANQVFKKIRENLGLQHCILQVTAAAPIKSSTLDYFGSLDIPLIQAYGASESAGTHTIGLPYHDTIGTIGVSIFSYEIKVDHDPKRDKKNEGELLLRGRNIMMGYIYDEDKSKKTIDNFGYYHSGDVGRVDKNDLFYITGRIKELIITAGGENVAPVPIEDYIKGEAEGISNIILIGDQKKYLTILVTLKCYQNMDTQEFTNKLVGQAKEVDPNAKTVDDARKSAAWMQYIVKAITKYNKDPNACASNAQKVQYFNILDGDFSIPGGELTGTMKLKRPIIVKKYAKQIEDMYTSEWTKDFMARMKQKPNKDNKKADNNDDEKKEPEEPKEAPKKEEEAPKKEEEAPKEEPKKEEAAKEEAPKEEAAKEEAPKEEAPKEEAPKE